MYRPLSARKEYYEKIIENIELAASNNKEIKDIILWGDLNFDYKLDESLSPNPVYWIEVLFELTQPIEKPTRRTLTTSSLLDVILMSRPEKHISSGVIQTTFSDHYLPKFTIFGKYVRLSVCLSVCLLVCQFCQA